jgi:transcriptional regulator with XRE-family HTH domain
MKLKDYLNEHDLTYSSFAEQIEVSPEAVRRYANNERIPEREVMKQITTKTKGRVSANDFYA